MKTTENTKVGSWVARLGLLVLVLVPLLYLQPFYRHFYIYLTGTVLTQIVTREWQLVIFFVVLFMLFLIPLNYRKRAKWVDYGLVGAFFISLFVEMYGIPLTILFASKYFFKHRVALPPNVIELEFLGVGLAMDHAMVYGAVVMILGMLLIIFGWWSLYWQSQRPGFAQRGLYAYSRHPQYLGFILLLVGWLIGWPTIITLIFSPILIYKYWRAARKEEQEMLKQYDQVYLKYIRKTPFFI